MRRRRGTAIPSRSVGSVRLRRYVRSALTELAADPGGDDLVDLLLLTTSELATNAVLHARTDFSVRVRVSDSQVRIEVSDGNIRMPQPC